MASYNELNALIDAYINRNGVQAITGQILNGVLKAMVEQLGRGYTIMGAAIPTSDPGTPDGPECYFASETGTYTDFDGLQVVPGELALLCYTPSDGWSKATIYEGFREVGATIDGNVGTPSVGVSYADGVLSFDFHNMKGNPGQNGQDGAAAGFGTIGADITGGVGTPAVTVESSGPATAKNLQFHFTNLKGETGVTSVVATVDNTSGTPSCAVSLQGQQLTLAFSGLKGAQGDTGSSVDYPFTIVNNLTTDDATQALSAAQGVVLQGELSQLEAKVNAKLGFEQAIPSYTDGYSLNNSGQAITNAYVTARGVSDFFKVTPGGQLYVQSGVYQGGNYNYAAIAFYSSNSESAFVSCINSAPYATEITDKTFTVPGTANYARVVLNDYSVPAIIGKQDKTVKELIDETNERIDESLSVDTDMSDTSTNAVENKVIKGYVDSVTGYPVSVIKSAIDGYSLDNSGQAITNAYVTARGVSDFFGVTPGGKLYVHSGVYQGGNYNYAAIAFYSSNSESAFVSCINSAPYFTEIIDKEFDVPSTASYARVVLNDYSVAAILGYGSSKTIKQRIDELSIAKNYGKGIVVLGGSHTARENSEAAKDIWRDKLGMSVYTAGVGSCGIIANITMYGWTYNGVSYYTRGGYNDGVNSRVWDDYGYLSDVKITAVGETTITLSDGNTYSRDTTKDYINNAQTKISRLLSKSALDKDIYVVWLSTNDYVQAKSLGTYSDYTEVDNYDTTKKWTDASHPGTICGGFNFILKTIRDNNPTAEIYLFTSFRYFNSDARGYDPYTSVVNTTGKNFYEYQQEVMKAAQVGGCAILDQFLLQGVGIGNYSTYYESDHLHLKVSGYEKIGYLQADFLRNGM